MHRDRLAETPYRVPLALRHLFDANAEQFEVVDDGHSRWMNYRFDALPGRYVIVVEFEADGDGGCIELRAFVNGEKRLCYGGTARWISQSYSDFILDVDEPGDILIQFMLPEHPLDQTFRLNGLTCSEVVDFPRPFCFAFA
jgi:hypothetical protein